MFPRRSVLLSYAVIWFWAGFLLLALSDLWWLQTVYGRDPECSTEFSTLLSYKFTKFESLSFNKLSSELLQLSRSAIEFSYGILLRNVCVPPLTSRQMAIVFTGSGFFLIKALFLLNETEMIKINAKFVFFVAVYVE